MKLLTFLLDGGTEPGVMIDDTWLVALNRWHDVYSIGEATPHSIKAMLEQGDGALDSIRSITHQVMQMAPKEMELAKQRHVLLKVSDICFAPPIVDPGVILMSGGAYRSHALEMKVKEPETPTGFIKSSHAVIGSGDAIQLPNVAPDMVDWEGEFACVIGRPCHDVSAVTALDYVAGYTIVNDVSARDWVRGLLSADGTPMEIARRAGLNHLGKQFPTFCPIGPFLVTKDELDLDNGLTITTRLNGKTKQSANTRDLLFRVAETVSYFSQWHRFLPGDVITTGSPAGVGFAAVPPCFMKGGDVIEVEVEGVGILRNRVAAPSGAVEGRAEEALWRLK
ncbi:hypothetical protein GCM10007242_27750 [Pigmentiphaga litoralis]|uniref:fumarylacetoacetate hydrolase family protein n=1 Tax=Pigmentiphaga litoralis TaxID=516702 RepID=UPI0016775979|nr:fumarylacetoacetate hydrolase family protein [Pigmentiphaga litoralis]GGX19349.1 hypothetical protein GCM10007242_27750 [Pigmentiphaga litoralis]